MLEIKQLTRLQIIKYCEKLEKENKNLKEKLDAFESSKFNTMALLEIQHPKTAREAENLLQVKKVFERLYNDRLYCLEEENRNLKKENKWLKADYIKLSKIVETTWWYKASYVNELRDKIAKLEQELKIYKKQYKHTMWEDYIDEDLYDLDC